MKNLFKVAVFVLSLSLVLFTVACDKEGGDNQQTTGTYLYKLETETVENAETGKNETKKYYVITGYEVNSDDALKMADGDFSTIKPEHRNITIPSTGKDLGLGDDNTIPVKKIDSGAFSNQVILKSVVVGANITEIGEGAFAGCTNLEKIELPFVGQKADAVNASRLFGYIFGASATGDGNVQITSKAHEVIVNGESVLDEAELTYYLPSSLKEVTLNTITEVSECAFYGVTTIKKVNIPLVTEIGSHAFFGCTALTSVSLPEVTDIYDYAFSGCTALAKVEFDKVKNIYDYAFSGCTSLGAKKLSANDTLVMPQSLEVLSKGAFSGCSSIVGIDVSASKITAIENSAFSGCTSLKTLTLKSGLVLKAGAFAGCTSLVKDNLTLTGVTVELSAFDFII